MTHMTSVRDSPEVYAEHAHNQDQLRINKEEKERTGRSSWFITRYDDPYDELVSFAKRAYNQDQIRIGKEEAEQDFGNAGDCNLLLVVDKRVGEKGVEACFKIADNQNGLVNRE